MPARTTETARVPEDISGRQQRVPIGGITWRHTFRALRHRNYRLFFWGQLVSILVATQAAQMICAFLVAAGVWLGFATTSFIIIVAALNGIAMGFDMPARQAFTVEMTSREDL